MKIKKLISIAITLLLLSSGIAAYAYQDGDFQIWDSNIQEVFIGKSTKFMMEEELRFTENERDFFYQHYDWGFAWFFDKRFELGLGYRLIFERYKRKWREEDDIYTNLIWKHALWKFKLEDRNRIEYRHFRFAPDHIRYRNRFIIRYPFEFKDMRVIPYAADEIFVSSNGRGFHQNRLQSGIEVEFNKYFKLDISYMLQSIRGTGDKWFTANVLWLKNKIAF